jgi:4-diphosphocytidyl-2-C-methyl-D-erythritol kinase
MQSLTLPAPAKLNLFLHINRRREDGYHDLQTLFQLLDFGDELTFSVNADNRLHFRCSNPHLETDDNLVIKAAHSIKPYARQYCGIDIYLDKILPAGGGIGGGSSDAATTLLALNYLWDCNLTIDQLAEIGRTLGADIPVFVRGQSSFAEGVGERLQAIDLPKKWFIVLDPGCHVSTAKIFSHKRLTRDTPVIKVATSFGQGTKNDCQTLVEELYSPVKEARHWLGQFGHARMTGTGACVFLSVDDENTAQTIFKQRPKSLNGFIAKGVNTSPAVEKLSMSIATGV